MPYADVFIPARMCGTVNISHGLNYKNCNSFHSLPKIQKLPCILKKKKKTDLKTHKCLTTNNLCILSTEKACPYKLFCLFVNFNHFYSKVCKINETTVGNVCVGGRDSWSTNIFFSFRQNKNAHKTKKSHSQRRDSGAYASATIYSVKSSYKHKINIIFPFTALKT